MDRRSQIPSHRFIPLLFFLGRLILLLALPLDGLRGYGDFIHFYQLAGLGTPFIDFWVEFPPLFPFLSSMLFRLTQGQQHVYDYLLVFLLTAFQTGSLIMFMRLAVRLHGKSAAERRSWIYFAFLLCIAYGWWYFDPIAVFTMLVGLLWVLEHRYIRAGIALAIGALVKWFPVLLLPAIWLYAKPRKALVSTALILGIVIAIWGGLYALAPRMTLASLGAQASKGSWETVWALVDGNRGTGNFGPLVERFESESARLPRGNPARLPASLSLIIFAAIGGWFFRRALVDDDRSLIAFLGVAWGVFLLWSPGWSPQWVLYLIPLLLLVLPERQGFLITIALVLINLLEWPVLLSRGLFDSLWLTISIRTLLLTLMIGLFWQHVNRKMPAASRTVLPQGEG